MPPTRRPLLLSLVLVLLLTPLAATAQTRLMRRFAEERGIVPPVWAIGQDSTGFLWIGAQGGLYRDDGNATEPVAPSLITSAVVSLAFHPAGGVAAVTERGELYEVRGGVVRRLRPPGTPGRRMLRMVAYDRAGLLWTIRGREVVVRRPDDEWKAMAAGSLAAEGARMVVPDPLGSVLVATDRGVWRLDGAGHGQRIIEARHIVDVAALADEVLILQSSGHLVRFSRAGADSVWLPGKVPALAGSRPVALTRRGRAVWVAFDRFLAALRADGAVEVLAPQDGIEGGGPLFVDREGSLWMAAFTSLQQFPEPDTRIWTDAHGLPSRHVRFLGRTGQVVWVSSWQGVARISTGPDGAAARAVTDWFSQQRFCAGADSASVWTSSERGLLELTADGIRSVHAAAGRVNGCAGGPGRTLWIAAADGVLRIRPDGALPERVALPVAADAHAPWQAVLEDSQGRLWLAREGRICSMRLPQPHHWQCSDVGHTGDVTGLLELPGGILWASTMAMGVLALGDDGWHRLPSSRALPTDAVFAIVRSTAGGAWILGHGIVQRVLPVPGGWRIVEQLGLWNGLPVTGGQDLLEDEGGGLWITTSLGVVQVPPSARFARMDPPPVVLVEAAVDGRRVRAGELLHLPFSQNRVELRFAALSFRDPGNIRYQVRLRDDGAWQESNGPPTFRWFDLRPGTYAPALRASIDGQRWSPVPATARFAVRPPWYLQPWVVASLVLLMGLAALAAYRARVRLLLRLERQRTRIASDLHDEIGSGLGSIGILAGVLSASGDGQQNGEERRRRLAREIAQTSEQLGVALSDIVWSLDQTTASLHELAARLAEHGNRLCAAEDGAEFTACLPAHWPVDRLSPAMRRNVLYIGFEALHNAVRHSGAERVTLRLRQVHRDWELCIEDDGCGMPASLLDGDRAGPERDGGRGLHGMRARALELGTRLRVETAPACGTRITLRFRLSKHARPDPPHPVA